MLSTSGAASLFGGATATTACDMASGEKTCIVRKCRAMKSNFNGRHSEVAPVKLGVPVPKSISTEPRLSIKTPNGAKLSRVIA